MLGSHGQPDWLDLSDYLVHFAKGDDDKGYETTISILWDGIVKRGDAPFGIARKVPKVAERQRAVCFSETPLGFVRRLVERRGTRFGIGFHKGFVQAQGGAPLWYLRHGSPQQRAVQELMERASAAVDADDPIWGVTPFVDFWADGDPYNYDFRWEREWRIADDLRFTPDDVDFLFIPEDLHQRARNFFKEQHDGQTGPAYFCPFLDPMWSVEKVEAGLRDVPEIFKESRRSRRW